MPVTNGRREVVAALGGAAARPLAARAQQAERGRAGRDGVHDQPRHFRKIEILASFRQRDPGIPHNVRALGGRLPPAPALRTWRPFPMRLGSWFACGAFHFQVSHRLWSRRGLHCGAHSLHDAVVPAMAANFWPPPSLSNHHDSGYQMPPIDAA
jgi:hypothetical protein